MKYSPDRRLQEWVFAWLVLSILSVAFESLRVVVPFAGGLIAGALLADFLLSLRERDVVLTRVVPEKGARERTDSVRLHIENPLSRNIELDVRESAPRDLVSPEPQWSRVRVEAGEVRQLAYEIEPKVRGRRVWGQAAALVRSPLGLLRRRIESASGDVILVQPESRRYLRSEALDPKRVLAELGVRPRKARGDGLEFESLREYVVGDEPRRVDWRATARRGRPIVRNFRHEESRTVFLVLDRSRLMGARAPHAEEAPHAKEKMRADADVFASTKLDHAIDAALALAFASLAAGDRVGLVLFDRKASRVISPVVDRRSLGLFVDALSAVQPVPCEADYRRMTREMLGIARKRAMVIVLTDFMEVDREELIAPMSLLARRHEVLFVALREPILEQLDGDISSDATSASDSPGNASGLFRRIVLSDLLREREGRLVRLRRLGLSVLDLPPNEVTAPCLNRFLELRHGVA